MSYIDDMFKMQKNMYESFGNMYSNNSDGKEKDSEGDKNFYDMQKKALEFWMDSVASFQKEDNKNQYTQFMNMQKDYFDSMKNFQNFGFNIPNNDFGSINNFNQMFNIYRDMYSNYEFTKIFTPNIMETIDKMYDANKFYMEMFEFYNKFNNEFIDFSKIDNEKLEKFIKENSEVTYDLILNSLPDELKIYVKQPRELMEKYINMVEEFYAPWKNEGNNLKNLFIEGTLKNDSEKITKFFKLWKTRYDETFGKFFNSPVLGINKNIAEEQNKVFDRFVDMFIISSEFSSKIMSTQRSAFKDIIKEYIELSEKGMQAKTFEEFYEFWSSRMDNYLVEYFGSKEFAKLMGEFGSRVMEFKIELNGLMEDYLSSTPIVTKGELDSTIKKVHDLKKEIKSLRKEIDLLNSEKPKEVKTK